MNSKQASLIPDYLATSPLQDVIKVVKGRKPKLLGNRSERLNVPYINIKAFEKNEFDQYTDGSDARFCDIDDVLIVWDGARSGLVGKGVKGAVGSTLGKLISFDLESDYLFYFLQSQYDYINSNPRGIGIPHVDPDIFWNIQIPIPPIPEQQRIVAKIEELFTQLDAGVAELQAAKAQLQRYRQAVLKAAVGGELTREWRKAHQHELEPASQLLARILSERRAKWEAEGGKGKYKEPVPPDTEGMPELPEGWVWATVEQINPFDRPCSYGVLKPGSDIEGGIPIVRVGDINNGKIYREGMKKISSDIAERYQRTKLQGGEVLISLVGAIGRTAVVPNSLAGANTARAVGVIPLPNKINPFWVEVWFRNPGKINEMTLKAHEVARKTLNLEDVRSATVALPSPLEQKRIVEMVERRLSVADEIERELDQALARSERLRQSILKIAFEGKLVRQEKGK